MTVKLYVSIGSFTLQAAGKLNITDKGVLSSLLRLASDDNSWKVKAHTIKGEKSAPVVRRLNNAIDCLNRYLE